MTDEIYVHRASKSHFVVGYCLRFYVETRFEAYFLIIFEAVFSKREILQARYVTKEALVEEEYYFCHSASLRIFSESGLDFDKIQSNLLVHPDHQHKIGDKRFPNSNRKPYANDMLSFESGLSDKESLEDHLLALWIKLKPYKKFIVGLKDEAKVDIFCGYRTDCETGGVDISSKALEIFQELKISFALSVIVT
jgi:hypothetical protein